MITEILIYTENIQYVYNMPGFTVPGIFAFANTKL